MYGGVKKISYNNADLINYFLCRKVPVMIKKNLFVSLSLFMSSAIASSSFEVEALLNSCHVTSGDYVEVISGNDKGKRGHVCGWLAGFHGVNNVEPAVDFNFKFFAREIKATKTQRKECIAAMKSAPVLKRLPASKLFHALAVKSNDGFQGVFHSSCLKKVIPSEPAEITQIGDRSEEEEE